MDRRFVAIANDCRRCLVELFLEQVEHPKLDGLPQLRDPLRIPLRMKGLAAIKGGIE
jgi:hypothetical protein